MDVFFVYGLVDSGEPDLIRYVGQTQSMSRRLKLHAMHLESYYGMAASWKWSVLFFGRTFEMRLIEVVYGDREKSLAREAFHISQQHQKTGRLTNARAYKSAQRLGGLSNATADSFLETHQLLRACIEESASESITYRVAKIIDRMETSHRSLMLCGRYDSFANAVEELYLRKIQVAA